MAPMNTVMSLDNRGYVNEQILAYYAARAKGGCGLIITECVLGTKLAAKFPFTSNLHCYDVSFAPGLLELSETIHAFGARTFIQMSIGFGRQGHAHDGSRPPAPSAIPYQVPFELLATGFPEVLMKYPVLPPDGHGKPPLRDDHRRDPLGAGRVRQLLYLRHGRAVRRDRAARAPRLPGAPVPLPRTNKRTDMYGGSLDNRMRFLVEVYLKVREAVGTDYIVGMRLSADEHMPDGFTHEEALYAARVMTQLGVDYVHLSDGSYEALKYFFPDKDGTMLDEAANFKEAVPVPVMVPIHPRPEERGEGDRQLVSAIWCRSAGRCWPTRITQQGCGGKAPGHQAVQALQRVPDAGGDRHAGALHREQEPRPGEVHARVLAPAR